MKTKYKRSHVTRSRTVPSVHTQRTLTIKYKGNEGWGSSGISINFDFLHLRICPPLWKILLTHPLAERYTGIIAVCGFQKQVSCEIHMKFSSEIHFYCSINLIFFVNFMWNPHSMILPVYRYSLVLQWCSLSPGVHHPLILRTNQWNFHLMKKNQREYNTHTGKW